MRFNCLNCDMSFANPMPEESLLEEFNSKYFHSAHGGKAQDIVSKSFFKGIAKLRASMINDFLLTNKVNVNKVLEIGPGDGYLTEALLKYNQDANYFAIETDISCHENLRKLNISIINHHELTNIKDVDLIVMSHVLEHVADPTAFLNQVLESLSKGGAIFIEVPCRDYLHKVIDEPHLLFFDKAPMKLLLEKVGLIPMCLQYYGKTIKELQNQTRFDDFLFRIRSKLLSMGLAKLFINHNNDLNDLDMLENAAVIPFKAHECSTEPAWWLRAVAIKPE